MAEWLDKEAAGPSKKVRRDCQYLLGKITAFFEAVKERTLVIAKFVTLISMYPMGVYQM